MKSVGGPHAARGPDSTELAYKMLNVNTNESITSVIMWLMFEVKKLT